MEYVTIIMLWGTFSGNSDIQIGKPSQNIIEVQRENGKETSGNGRRITLLDSPAR
jgi:hypothetical protein